MNTTPVVELENLKVRLGRREILHGITCRLGVSGTGKAVGLLGPNGAGKSTLILTLLGFLRPSAGRARILGLDCRHSMGEARSRIGYMPENDSFIGDMTAVTFLRQMAELSGLPPEAALEKAHQVLFHVGLGEARYREIRTYSLGMKQMAKLAQAIVHGPELVVLDEPTNGLDPAARRRMLKLIAEMKNEQGMNVLVCSHLLRDIEQVCDEAVIMKDGAIVHHCNLEEERRSNRHFVELEVTGDDAEPARGAARDRRRRRSRRPRALAHRPAARGRSGSHLGTRGAAEPPGQEAHPPPGLAGGNLPESHGAPGADARREPAFAA